MMPYAVFGAAMPPPSSAEAYWKVRKYSAEGFMNFPLWLLFHIKQFLNYHSERVYKTNLLFSAKFEYV